MIWFYFMQWIIYYTSSSCQKYERKKNRYNTRIVVNEYVEIRSTVPRLNVNDSADLRDWKDSRKMKKIEMTSPFNALLCECECESCS